MYRKLPNITDQDIINAVLPDNTPLIYTAQNGEQREITFTQLISEKVDRLSSTDIQLLIVMLSHIGSGGYEGWSVTVKDGEIGKHDWCLGEPCGDGILVFVDDRPISYRKTPETARALAMEVIVRIQADGDYRLNDKPAGFMPPPLHTTKQEELKPIFFSGGVKSISDDDLCSDCKHCEYRPGEMSGCKKNWPGKEDADGYVRECTELDLISFQEENWVDSPT